MRRGIALGLVLALAACGGSSSSSSSSSSATTSASATQPELVAPPGDWDALSFDERREHMTRHVIGPMTDLFVGYDAARFDDFSCATCHGEGAARGDYAMPNPALPVVYPSGTVGQEQMVQQFPDGARFMFQRVIPAMQTLLGEEPYDPATGEGMSCFACHARASEDDPLNVPASE